MKPLVCERVIGELRRELFDRILIVNEEHLRRTLAHRNEARLHPRARPVDPGASRDRPPAPVNLVDHRIRRKAILGGLGHEYQIAA
jgi:hypothetical protein